MTSSEIPPILLVILTLQGLVFAAFTYFAFRTLFRLRGHALKVKRPHTGLASEVLERQRADLVTFRYFAVAPEYRTERRRLLALVASLFALIGFQIALTDRNSPQGAPAMPAEDRHP